MQPNVAYMDYYHCDRCHEKAFYDGDLDDRFRGIEIAALCATCAQTHELVVQVRSTSNQPAVDAARA